MTVELWALDRLEQIARITDYTRVEIVERDLAEGAWLVELPLGDASGAGAALLAATWPGIEAYDPETGWRFGGYLTAYRVLVEEDGTATLRLLGSDFQSDLAAWLEWPDFTTPDNWWVNTVGGTIAATTDLHNTVSSNAGPGAVEVGRPAIDGIVMGDDPAAGPPKARRLKGEPLLAVARFLLYGTDWTARLHLVRSATGEPSVRFDTPARPLAGIVLDAKLGTAGRIEHGENATTVTWLLGMGAEITPVVTPGERLQAITSYVMTNWRFRRREAFISRPATDDLDALSDEISAQLQAGRSSRSVVVDSARVGGYGRDIDLGWRVSVHLGPQFQPSTVTLTVAASTLSFTTAGGWARTVDVGSESLTGPAAIYAAIAKTRTAARQIENDL